MCEELGETWSEQSILEDPQLADQYFESIPVTMIDGKIHDKWRVDEARLRAALTKKTNYFSLLRQVTSVTFVTSKILDFPSTI